MTAVFLWRPGWGVALLIASLPFERIGSFALNPSAGYPVVRPSQLVGAALIAAVAGRLLLRWERLRWPAGGWWLVGLAAVGGLAAYSIHYRQTWIDYASALFVLLLFLAVAQESTREHWRLIRASLFFSASAVCLFGLYQFIGDTFGLPISFTGLRGEYTKIVFGFPRVQSTEPEPLYFANYLLLPILASAALYIATKKKWLSMLLVLFSLTFALTVSRGAFIALIVALPVLLIGLRRSLNWQLLRRSILITAVVGVALAAGLGLISLATHNTSVFRSFADLVGPKFNQTGTLTERVQAQRQAYKIFLERPLIGHGIGGYTWRILNYPTTRVGGERIIVNNEPLELLTEVGLIGFACYLGFLLTLVWKSWRAARFTTTPIWHAWIFGLIAAMSAVWVQYLSFSGFYITYIWALYGLLAGAANRNIDKAV
jgi:hypothetical protein